MTIKPSIQHKQLTISLNDLNHSSFFFDFFFFFEKLVCFLKHIKIVSKNHQKHQHKTKTIY